MKKKLLSFALAFLFANGGALAQETSMYFGATVGDKISLYGNYLGDPRMYGLGIEPSTLYFKSNGYFRWYIKDNADGGTSDTLQLTEGNLQLTTRGTSLDGFMATSTDGAWFKLMPRLSQGNYTGLTRTGDMGLIFSGGTQNSGGLTIAPWNSVGAGLRMNSAGNVGIGVPDPANKLDVNGTIRAKEVIVETAWADYVFKEDYVLPSLGEVKTHIREHRRLPGVPSAEEVTETGVSLGDSQRILLEKIEELTLYILQQEERIGRLEGKLYEKNR